MARIRSLKPEFWTDSKVVKISPLARLLFLGLLNFADDDGRMAFDLLTIKLQILPLDSTDCSGELGEIRGNAMVTVYEAGGREYLQVNNFSKHQKVDKRTPSKFPAPPPNPAELPRIPPNPPPGGEGKGVEGKGGEQKAAYAFEGLIIRLTQSDLDKLAKAYHAIPDMVAELTAIDAKFVADPPPKWHPRLNGWLKQAHEKRLAAPAQQGYRKGEVRRNVGVL